MYKPKLLVHFPCQGHIWQLFSNATVTFDGKHFETLIRDGELWVPKRETFMGMCRLWGNAWGLPTKIKKDLVVKAGIMKELIEEGIQSNATY